MEEFIDVLEVLEEVVGNLAVTGDSFPTEENPTYNPIPPVMIEEFGTADCFGEGRSEPEVRTYKAAPIRTSTIWGEYEQEVTIIEKRSSWSAVPEKKVIIGEKKKVKRK